MALFGTLHQMEEDGWTLGFTLEESLSQHGGNDFHLIFVFFILLTKLVS